MNSKLFKSKYRIKSIRLQEWDYSWDGYYHVIIFVEDRRKFPLGKIVNGKMCLSKEGKIVRENLLDSINHYSNCGLDAFAIMPNHVHGLIKIGKGIMEFPMDIACSKRVEPIHGRNREANYEVGVEPIHESALQDKNVRRKMLLFKIIGQFKMRSAKFINLYRNTPGKPFWQTRFYDRIIRDEEHLNQVREYINKNVIKEWWKINNLDID